MSSPQQPDDRSRRPDRDRPGAPGDEPTEAVEGPASGFVYEQDADEYEPYVTTGPDRTADQRDDAEPDAAAAGGNRIWRDVAAGAVGLLLGFVAALVVVALGTTDTGVDAGELAATQERVTALEAQLAEREAELAEAQAAAAELATVQEQVGELEAQVAQRDAALAEAEAAAGERAADVEAQREALDQRAAALDERARALDQRESAVESRELELAERERDVDQPGRPALPELPLLDDDSTQTIVDRVVDQIRELFGRQD